jgi:hypothetical protein
LIEEGEYISFVNSKDIIAKYTTRYKFLSMASDAKTLNSLE